MVAQVYSDYTSACSDNYNTLDCYIKFLVLDDDEDSNT